MAKNITIEVTDNEAVKRDGDKIIFEIPVDRVKDLFGKKVKLASVPVGETFKIGGDPVKEAIAWRDKLKYELDLLLDKKSAIERRAVEEFVGKFKEKAHKGAFRDPITYKFIERDYTITESELNELLRSMENEQETN